MHGIMGNSTHHNLALALCRQHSLVNLFDDNSCCRVAVGPAVREHAMQSRTGPLQGHDEHVGQQNKPGQAEGWQWWLHMVPFTVLVTRCLPHSLGLQDPPLLPPPQPAAQEVQQPPEPEPAMWMASMRGLDGPLELDLAPGAATLVQEHTQASRGLAAWMEAMRQQMH